MLASSPVLSNTLEECELQKKKTATIVRPGQWEFHGETEGNRGRIRFRCTAVQGFGHAPVFDRHSATERREHVVVRPISLNLA